MAYKDLDKRRKRDSEYRKEHRAERREWNKKWRRGHPAECKRSHAEYRKKHRDQEAEYQKAWRKKHPAELAAGLSRYRKKHCSERRAYWRCWQRDDRDRLGDTYIRGLITQDGIIRAMDVPQEIVDLYRAYLTLKREAKKVGRVVA